MAKVYTPPTEAGDMPDLGDFMGAGKCDVPAYFDALHAWEDRVADVARSYYPDGGDLQGYVFRHGVADGKASYVVARTKPLELWIVSDEYQLPEAHERGLTVTDIRKAKKFDDLFRAKTVAK